MEPIRQHIKGLVRNLSNGTRYSVNQETDERGETIYHVNLMVAGEQKLNLEASTVEEMLVKLDAVQDTVKRGEENGLVATEQ